MLPKRDVSTTCRLTVIVLIAVVMGNLLTTFQMDRLERPIHIPPQFVEYANKHSIFEIQKVW